MPTTLHERAEEMALAERDPEEYRLLFLARCQKDPVFFISVCLWTFDPRLDGENRFLPFLLFKQQEEFILMMVDCIRSGKDFLVEKSRDTGASWCALAVVFWMWMFEPSFTCLLGSRKEDLVDKKNEAACLMWKLDEMYRSLPEWMKVPGYKADKPHRTHLMMSNPMNGSVISGESANPNFGRQGRYSIVLMDEAAFWANLRAAYTSCGESTKCRGLVSTPNGMNLFGKLANPKKAKKGEKQVGPRKFRLHWSQDPRHNHWELCTDPESNMYGRMINPWYEEQKLRYAYDVEVMAQELEIDYKSSVKGRYYPQIDLARFGSFPYDPTLPLYSLWDFGSTDDTAIIWWQFNPDTLRNQIVEGYANRGKQISFYIPFITGLMPGDPNGETYTPRDLEVIKRHSGWRHTAHFGDPSGRQVEQTSGTSVIDELSMARIYVTTNTKENSNRDRRAALAKFLLRCDFNEELCEDLIDALRNSKFPERPEGSETTSPNNKPVHDEYSHYRTAMEFGAVNNPHRWQVQDTDSGMMVARRAAERPGAIFGAKLLPKIGGDDDEYDEWEDYGYDESDFPGEEDHYQGVGKAGY